MKNSTAISVVVLLSVAAGTSPGQAVRDKSLAEATQLIGAAKGSVVVFHLYASWCPACVEQFPVINRLGERYKKHPFKIVAVSLDEKPAKLQEFLGRMQPLHLEPWRLAPRKEDVLATLKAAGLKTFEDKIPYTAIFDMSGKCIREYTGVADFRSLYPIIDNVYIAASPNARPATVPPVSPEPPGKLTPPSPLTKEAVAEKKESKEEAPDEEEPRPAGLPMSFYLFGGGLGIVLLLIGVFSQMLRRPTPAPRPRPRLADKMAEKPGDTTS